MSEPTFCEDYFEPRPRWPNGPPICLEANLPAFVSMSELDEFHTTNAPSCPVIRRWQCDFCLWFHEETHAPAPSGASSGTSRVLHKSLFS
jgi:hypothetical protein